MIEDLKISYILDNSIQVTISSTNNRNSVDTYNVLDLFIKIIKDSNANPDIIINNLINEFNYKNE